MSDWLLVGLYPWQKPTEVCHGMRVPVKCRLDHETLAKLDYQMVIARADAHMLPVEWAKAIMPQNRVSHDQWNVLDWWLVRENKQQ